MANQEPNASENNLGWNLPTPTSGEYGKLMARRLSVPEKEFLAKTRSLSPMEYKQSSKLKSNPYKKGDIMTNSDGTPKYEQIDQYVGSKVVSEAEDFITDYEEKLYEVMDKDESERSEDDIDITRPERYKKALEFYHKRLEYSSGSLQLFSDPATGEPGLFEEGFKLRRYGEKRGGVDKKSPEESLTDWSKEFYKIIKECSELQRAARRYAEEHRGEDGRVDGQVIFPTALAIKSVVEDKPGAIRLAGNGQPGEMTQLIKDNLGRKYFNNLVYNDVLRSYGDHQAMIDKYLEKIEEMWKIICEDDFYSDLDLDIRESIVESIGVSSRGFEEQAGAAAAKSRYIAKYDIPAAAAMKSYKADLEKIYKTVGIDDKNQALGDIKNAKQRIALRFTQSKVDKGNSMSLDKMLDEFNQIKNSGGDIRTSKLYGSLLRANGNNLGLSSHEVRSLDQMLNNKYENIRQDKADIRERAKQKEDFVDKFKNDPNYDAFVFGIIFNVALDQDKDPTESANKYLSRVIRAKENVEAGQTEVEDAADWQIMIGTAQALGSANSKKETKKLVDEAQKFKQAFGKSFVGVPDGDKKLDFWVYYNDLLPDNDENKVDINDPKDVSRHKNRNTGRMIADSADFDYYYELFAGMKIVIPPEAEAEEVSGDVEADPGDGHEVVPGTAPEEVPDAPRKPEQILKEAEEAAARVIKEAEAKAAEIKEQAKKEAKEAESEEKVKAKTTEIANLIAGGDLDQDQVNKIVQSLVDKLVK
ncbi:MAG: hypothetical protein LBL08_02230 [Candidatus Nomurabacteria bacterium]|jgi:hypothetical protein|nr:hypothetical protein [Candidatus Nomurabacteria bacterium]